MTSKSVSGGSYACAAPTKLTLIQPTTVHSLPGYRLYLEFSDGEKGKVDLSDLAGKGVFEVWNDYNFFEQVHIAKHRAIQWNDEIALCPTPSTCN